MILGQELDFVSSPPAADSGPGPFIPIKAKGAKSPALLPTGPPIVGDYHGLVGETVALLWCPLSG